MTKSELINRIYKNTKHFSVVDVESAVKAILKTLNTAISTGQRVEVRNFGSFSLRERSERISRNPRTGEPVKLGKRYSVHFKPGVELKERVNKSFLDSKK